MHDIRDTLRRWATDSNTPIVLATVTALEGSGLRKPGATFAVAANGEIAGSISGGCVEPRVCEAAEHLMAGQAHTHAHIHIEAEAEFIDSPLAPCSQAVDIHLTELDTEVLDAVERAVQERRKLFWGIYHRPDGSGNDLFAVEPLVQRVHGAVGRQTLAQHAAELKQAVGELVRPARIQLGGAALFVCPLELPPRLIIIGGTHIAQHLSCGAAELGYEVHVCDPRSRFLSPARFADSVHPHNGRIDRAMGDIGIDAETAVVVLSHDDKIDDPALRLALESKAFYIGALGSTKTHTARRLRLSAEGIPDSLLDRIHGPIGLRIGAVSPAEIAVSILGELVATWRGR